LKLISPENFNALLREVPDKKNRVAVISHVLLAKPNQEAFIYLVAL